MSRLDQRSKARHPNAYHRPSITYGSVMGWAIGLLITVTVVAWHIATDLPFMAGTPGQALVHAISLCVVALLTMVALRDLETTLVALPFLAATMTAPDVPGLPFIREFGSVALLVVAARLAATAIAIGPRRAMAAAQPLFGHRAFLLLCLSVLATIPAWIWVILTGPLMNAKVVTSHIAQELLIVLMIAALALAHQGKHTLTLLLDGLFGLSLLMVVGGIVMTVVSSFVAGPMAEHSLFGFLYYCRVQLTFFGPDHLGTFIAAVTPILLYYATANDTLWKRKAALAALVFVPLVVIGTGSRSGRIELLVILAVSAMFRDFRRVAIPIGLLAAGLIAATFGCRCVNDIVQGTAYGGIISPDTFLHDPERAALRQNFFEFLSPAKIDSWSSTFAYFGRLAFGVGVGIPAYEQFNVGTHMAYFDGIISKGLVGSILLFASLGALFIGIGRDIRKADPETRRLGAVIVLSILPFPMAAAIWDIGGWLFFWFFIGLAFAFSFALSSAPKLVRTADENNTFSLGWGLCVCNVTIRFPTPFTYFAPERQAGAIYGFARTTHKTSQLSEDRRRTFPSPIAVLPRPAHCGRP